MFNFPWSNFHELNLDWILSVVKEAKEIFVKGEGDIQHAVETADQALETAEQAAAGVIADGAVTIPKLNSEIYSLFAYCVSGSVAPNFIPAGALVILRKSTIYNVTDGIYTATRNIPQAAVITAADLDQSATLYREGGMNYLLHNVEDLSGTLLSLEDAVEMDEGSLAIPQIGDEATATIPAWGFIHLSGHSLYASGIYQNISGLDIQPGQTFTLSNISKRSEGALTYLYNRTKSVTGTVTKDSAQTNLSVSNVSVKQFGNVVSVNGYFTGLNAITENTATAIATISGVSLPSNVIRSIANISGQPNTTGVICYCAIATDGRILVNSKTATSNDDDLILNINYIV